MMMSKECAEIMTQDTSKYDIEIKRSSSLEEAPGQKKKSAKKRRRKKERTED